MKEIITIIIFIILILFIAHIGIKKYEKVECLRWQAQSEKYPNFYWTDWQIKQCKEVLK